MSTNYYIFLTIILKAKGPLQVIFMGFFSPFSKLFNFCKQDLTAMENGPPCFLIAHARCEIGA